MTKLATAYQGPGRHPKHRYLFQVGGKTIAVRAKVRPGKGRFTVMLTEEHVQRAIKLNGHGDAANCAGTVCVKSHGDVIPHKFTGYCDFWKKAAFLSSRNNSHNLPSDCVAWRHNRPEIPELFDNKNGLVKLLKKIRIDGPIEIEFTTPKYQRSGNSSRTSGQSDPLKRKFRIGHHARTVAMKTGGWAD